MEMFNENPSPAAVAAAADEIWLLYRGAAERHTPEDISLILAQKDVEGIVFRLGMPRLLLAGVLVNGVEVNDLFRLLRAVDASKDSPTGSSAPSCKRKRRSTNGAAARG